MSEPSISSARIALRVAALLIPLGSFAVVYECESWSEPVELDGVVVGLFQEPGYPPHPTRFLVRLSDGRTVEVYGTQFHTFRRGEPVVVAEQRSAILHRTIHRLVRLVPQP